MTGGANPPDVAGGPPSESDLSGGTPTGPDDRPVSLCLSGGGFRAALFHLGVVRRLNEVAALSLVDTVTSVSGGSVLAAHLANMLENGWPPRGEIVEEWEEWVAAPFRRFTSEDLSSAPILSRFWPWNWFRPYVTVRFLAARYRNRLTRQRLDELPAHPRFVVLATDMAFGVDWTFERTSMGNYEAGRFDPRGVDVADAVAASSAFPPSFDPFPLSIDPQRILERGDAPPAEVDPLLPDYELTDGGIYDNLGLEPVWKRPGTLLVSDGGGTFKVEEEQRFFRRLFRYVGVMDRQGSALRRRWLLEKLDDPATGIDGAYVAIGQTCATHDPAWSGPTYGPDLVRQRIAAVRTNMDRFTEAERQVLENHGYLIAAAAVPRRVPSLALRDAPIVVPHPDWMDEARVWRALAKSGD